MGKEEERVDVADLGQPEPRSVSDEQELFTVSDVLLTAEALLRKALPYFPEVRVHAWILQNPGEGNANRWRSALTLR